MIIFRLDFLSKHFNRVLFHDQNGKPLSEWHVVIIIIICRPKTLISISSDNGRAQQKNVVWCDRRQNVVTYVREMPSTFSSDGFASLACHRRRRVAFVTDGMRPVQKTQRVDRNTSVREYWRAPEYDVIMRPVEGSYMFLI